MSRPVHIRYVLARIMRMVERRRQSQESEEHHPRKRPERLELTFKFTEVHSASY